MYTFNPIETIPVSHVGFWFITFPILLFYINLMITDEWRKIPVTLATALVILFSYCVSFVWTDQQPKEFKNEQVTAQFVRYVAEGYNETIQSGKTTRHVDVHKVYVVYRVNGSEVLFEGRTGVEYPQTAILYKN